jgi:hypothetical protein
MVPVAILALALDSCGSGPASGNPAPHPSGDGGGQSDGAQGTPWREVSFPTQAGTGYNAVAYGNGRWVAVGNGVTATSTDGTTWSVQSLAPSAPNYGNAAMSFANGLFVSAGSGISTSSDGVAWSTTMLADAQGLGASAFGGGTWVVLDNRFLTEDAFAVWTSQDAAHWTSVVTTIPYAELGAIAYGNGQFVAVAWGSFVATSPDGAHWTMQSFPTQDGLSAVAFGNGFFLAGGTSGPAYRSADGKTWTPPGMDVGAGVLCFGNGRFLTGSLFDSADGMSWTENPESDSQGQGGLNACAWGAGHFLLVGSSAYFVISP